MRSVQPLLLTASDSGGAGTATRRIHQGLRKINVDSRLIVRDKVSDDSATYGPKTKISNALSKVRPQLDSLPLKFYNSPSEYSLSWVPDRLDKRVDTFNPDVIHLNWVAGGFMDTASIGDFDKPIIWRFPDMWPLTGGCHYADGCTRYQSTCGACPQLNSSHTWDPSRVTLSRKKRAVERADVTVVATTSWLAECARESTIFEDCEIEIIPNGLDTEIFKPYDPWIGRDLFGFPSETLLIVFGAVSPLSNHRKGYDLLVDALKTLSSRTDQDVELAVFGASEPEDPPNFGFPTHYTGYLNDEESLALLYSAADVMVVPSRYEGFGQTVSEAMACGTPVVGFNATGPGEIIEHKNTGYLASPYDSNDLAKGIEWILADNDRRARLSNKARDQAVNQYQLTDVARQYRSLYRDRI